MVDLGSQKMFWLPFLFLSLCKEKILTLAMRETRIINTFINHFGNNGNYYYSLSCFTSFRWQKNELIKA